MAWGIMDAREDVKGKKEPPSKGSVEGNSKEVFFERAAKARPSGPALNERAHAYASASFAIWRFWRQFVNLKYVAINRKNAVTPAKISTIQRERGSWSAGHFSIRPAATSALVSA